MIFQCGRLLTKVTLPAFGRVFYLGGADYTPSKVNRMTFCPERKLSITVQGINLELPPALYQRLVEIAEASRQPLTDIVIQSIQTGLPPGLEHVPDRFRDDLKALNQLSDDLLLDVVNRDLTEEKAELYEQLPAKNQQGALAGKPAGFFGWVLPVQEASVV